MESFSSLPQSSCACAALRSESTAVSVWAALLLLIVGRLAHAEEFFPTRDENPLLRGFYLPLASDSQSDAGTVLAATFSIANTLNVESRGGESLFVDGESDTLRLSFEDALGKHARYRITVPVIHDSGGFLDPVIDSWHRWFGFQRGYRPDFPNNRVRYFYAGKTLLDVNGSHSSVGDVSIDTGWYWFDDTAHTVSFWGGLEAPTGSVSRLSSDGAWDAAAWAHFAQRWSHWQLAGEFGVAQPLGDDTYGGAAHRISTFARGAVTRDLTAAWSVRAQLDGQTGRVRGSELRFLGPSLQLTLGAVRRVLAAGSWSAGLRKTSR